MTNQTDKEKELENRPAPFSKERTKAIICKIIFFYSLFFVIMKVIAIFKGAVMLPNLLLSIPFLVFAAVGFHIDRNKRYSWLYVILGVLVISATRYYEFELLQYFQDTL